MATQFPNSDTAQTGDGVARIMDAAVARLAKVPMMTDVAARALEIAKDPNCKVIQFAGVVERDPSLAADVLRLANSAIHGTGQPVDNISRAVVRLGFRECQNLILASSVCALMQKVPLTQAWYREALWRHSFTVGSICRHANRALELGFQGEEFTAGLIHDIGRILLAVGASELFEEVDQLTFDEGPDTLLREREILSTDHCECGVWFAERNRLPSSLIAPIRFHHSPDESMDHRCLVALVATADHMANYLQRNETSDHYDIASNPGLPFLVSCRNVELVSRFEEMALLMMEEANNERETMSIKNS